MLKLKTHIILLGYLFLDRTQMSDQWRQNNEKDLNKTRL